MAEQEFKGTSIDKGRGDEEFFEVEELIKETLEETKKEEIKKPAAPPQTTTKKKEEFKATKISAQPKAKTPPPPAETKAAVPAKTEAVGYESTFKEYKVGDIVKGTVIKVDPTGVLVDIKYKADGFIPPESLSDKTGSTPEEVVKVGDLINVYIENLENKEGYIVLSKKLADQELKWKNAYNAYKSKKALEGKVLQVLKGGLLLDCDGIRGFVPASQVSKKPNESLESFKDKTLPVKVIEINRRQGRIVLSHKLGITEKGKQESQKLFDQLEAGQIKHGTVSSLKNFGAFVNLGGVEGLIHLSELSWKRVKHPSVLLKVGQEIDVLILSVDKVNKKIALGLKELQPDPWEKATEYYKPGQIVKAKIVRFAKFGAFAELEHDLEGLIHNTELAKEPVHNPADAVKIGDEVDVKVLRVLPEEQKIGLSIREVLLDKERKEIKQATKTEEPPKVTIGDMIAQKEKERAEREVEEAEEESAPPQESQEKQV